MSLLSAVGLKKSDEEKRAEAADDAKVRSDNANAIVLANYRQTSKNQYDRLKNNRYAPYAGVNAYAQAAHIPGMSGPQESVVSLQDTGVGAPQGSNYAGYDEDSHGPNGPAGNFTGTRVHHAGIGELQFGENPQHAGIDDGHRANGYAHEGFYTEHADNGTDRRFKIEQGSTMGGGDTVAPTYMPGAGAPMVGGAQAPGTQYKFFPGGR